MVSKQRAAGYGRARFEGHRAALDAALSGPQDVSRSPRNLAVHASLAGRGAP
jgi:hypothetical protein